MLISLRSRRADKLAQPACLQTAIRGDVSHLRLYPVFYGIGHDGLAQRLCPATAFLVGHGEGLVDGVGLLVEVEGVYGEGVIVELLVRPCVLGEDEDAVP